MTLQPVFRKQAPAMLVLLALFGSGYAAQAETPVPPYLSEAEAAKRLPATLPPERFAKSEVQKAYQIAKRIPRIIAQQPCLCWCSRGGHRSLLDCYVDEHASFCDICMKEAFLADRMQSQGKSAAAIRAAIVNGEWRNL